MPGQTFSQVSAASKQNLHLGLFPLTPSHLTRSSNTHSASPKHTSPQGLYHSLSSASHNTWHSGLLPHREPYTSAILPFMIHFPERCPDDLPRIEISGTQCSIMGCSSGGVGGRIGGGKVPWRCWSLSKAALMVRRWSRMRLGVGRLAWGEWYGGLVRFVSGSWMYPY
ncbi:hypothetical protein B9Z19DRAFT_517788 [Tuber borchii]|uniref:Uncharacterized protein n=1 Tax=Tuber borchii TaxID=42251 RepID=A0A2T6ZE00_TUBBO|nr:hypothetical protein B9Z19DRAFT_517788 [Tuber borchii]